MNYKAREYWFFWGLVTLVFLLFVFSEWRAIDYQLCGSRSASPVDLIFLSGGVIFLVMLAKKNGANYLLRQIISLWYFLLPIALMVFFYNDRSALSNVPVSFTRYLLFGLSVYMLLPGFALARYPEKKILAYLMGYILIVTAFFLVIYVFTRAYPLKPFLYGEGTPSLNFPFGSPNQMAIFGVLNLILGVGVVLALRKFYFLYLIVPVMVLGVIQTGSRSLALLMIVGGGAFILLILFQWVLLKKCLWRGLANLLFSMALATIVTFLSLDAQGERALSFIYPSHSLDIASGKVDPFRNNMSKLWSSDSGMKGEIHEGGAHNAYLDLWLNWGKLSLAGFIAFLLLMFFSSMRLLWHKRTAPSYPLYGALLISLGVIAGAIYGNPLLHLKFVWVLFGLIISFLLNKYTNNNAVR